MTPEELRDWCSRVEGKLDALADMKWRVIAHEYVAAAAVVILGAVAAFR